MAEKRLQAQFHGRSYRSVSAFRRLALGFGGIQQFKELRHLREYTVRSSFAKSMRGCTCSKPERSHAGRDGRPDARRRVFNDDTG
jgi:hypothetical protein